MATPREIAEELVAITHAAPFSWMPPKQRRGVLDAIAAALTAERARAEAKVARLRYAMERVQRVADDHAECPNHSAPFHEIVALIRAALAPPR